MPDPQKIRYEEHAGRVFVIGETPSMQREVRPDLDDLILSETLAAGRDVFIPIHLNEAPLPRDQRNRIAKILEILRRDPGASLQEVGLALDSTDLPKTPPEGRRSTSPSCRQG